MKPVEILLVEDNPGDVELTQEGLRGARVANRLHAVGNGLEALAFLRREPPYAAVPRPDLILLDLNLPQMDGRELLHEVKQDRDLRRIPVVILSSSDAERDIARSYDLHANCYLMKPAGLAQFLDVVRTIEAFWLERVKLPTGGQVP